MRLEIVTPEKRILDAEVDSVTVPTASGEAGILPSHAPMVSAVKPGVLAYTIKGSTDRIAVAAGFVEINSDKVSVLVDAAETAGEIDGDLARAEKDAADRALTDVSLSSTEDLTGKREAAEHAAARFEVAAGR